MTSGKSLKLSGPLKNESLRLGEIVTEYKFMCLSYSEAKQIETSEFGAEKGLLQAKQGKLAGICSKNPPITISQVSTLEIL